MPINILIVDDEPANLALLEAVLEDPGYRIVRALSAEQALRALMDDEFAVLVLDIQLPDMNGIELAQLIKERQQTAHLPIIFLTAHSYEDQHRLKVYGTGAVDYLSKPVNATILRSKVAVFAELHRKTREIQRANTALLAEVEERRRAEESLRELNETLERRVSERTEELQLRREQLLAAEQAARSALERAAHAKEQFIAAVSHELRTPLAAIVGWANVLAQPGVEPATVQRGIQAIARNAQAQSVLVSDLLEMSRLITGKLRIDMQPVDLNDIAAGAADTARPTAESRQLVIELQMSPQPAAVTGDPGRLMQIAMNLVTNAMKFTPAGGRVTIATTVVEDAVELRVSDTGQGIDAAFIPQLFDRFSQADDIAARTHGGLGLGLSIVKNLTEQHGGEVSACSAGLGRGAVFVVRLPRAGQATCGAAAELADQAGDRSVAGLKVLLVDDHADVLEAHARLLSEQGAVVTTAQSALAALALLAAHRFDILLSDLGMPGLDGYGLIRQVRGELGLDAQALPAIAVTAFVRSEDRDAALEAGYQSCLQKPVSPVQFVRAVARFGARPPADRPLRAFFVEDNDDLREQITWMLEEEGLAVQAFARAEEALAAYEPAEVDVVVTDVSLMGMSGVDLARAILSRAPQAWVVFSSGYAMGNDLTDFGPHVRALLKPFDFADLRRLVDEIRAGRASQ